MCLLSRINFPCSFCLGSMPSHYFRILFPQRFEIFHIYHLYVLSCFSRIRLFATPWPVACQAPLSVGFSRQEYTGVGGHVLLQEISLTQGSNPRLLSTFHSTTNCLIYFIRQAVFEGSGRNHPGLWLVLSTILL